MQRTPPAPNANLNNNKTARLYTLLSLQALQAIPNYAAPLLYVPDHRSWANSNN